MASERSRTMRRAAGVTLLVLLSANSAANTDGPENCSVLSEVTDLGYRDYREVPIRPPSRFRSSSPFEPNRGRPEPRYMRVLLVRKNEEATGWTLTVRDPQHRFVQAIVPSDFSGPTLWTRRVPGVRIWFELELGPNGGDPELKTEAYIGMPRYAKNPLYSRTEASPDRDLHSSTGVKSAWKQRGDAVAFLTLSWGKRSWCCSGIMLNEQLLLTNWHCGGYPAGGVDEGLSPEFYWSRPVCESALVDLSWDGDAISREYVVSNCDDVVTNRALDYALLRVRPIEDLGPLQSAALRSEAAEQGEKLVLLHHAGCKPKLISDSCRVSVARRAGWRPDSGEVDFAHGCSSERGSSGGPVFDLNGRLVGLHHLGFDRDDECRPTDRDNKAVHLGDILRSLDPELCREIVGTEQVDVCIDF